MNKIMVTCPATFKHVSTGIITDKDTFDHLPASVSSMNCPHCGMSHPWTVKDAWLEGTKHPTADPLGGILFFG